MLVVIYYLLPLNRSSTAVAVTLLIIGLVALMGLVTYQVRSIIRSSFPLLRGVEALATSIPLFLLLFAATYVVLATISAGNFSQPLSRTDAIYFTVTVFATVGFGDITAKTEVARLVVTGQMLADLIVLGLGVRVLLSAVQRGRQRPRRHRHRPARGVSGTWPRLSSRSSNQAAGCPGDYLQDLDERPLWTSTGHNIPPSAWQRSATERGDDRRAGRSVADTLVSSLSLDIRCTPDYTFMQ